MLSLLFSKIQATSFTGAVIKTTESLGMKRSRCERQFLRHLRDAFPQLKMVPNDRRLLPGYEVDIAIPALKTAIEWNGICHFQPIYGATKLKDMQRRDAERAALADARGITLLIVEDRSSTEKFVHLAAQQIGRILRKRLHSKTSLKEAS